MRNRYGESLLGAVEGSVVNHRVLRRRIDLCWSLGVIAVLLGACQGPSEPGSKATEAETSPAPTTQRLAPNAGVVPITRDQRITALRKSLARPLSRSLEGLNVETLPNGKHGVHLQGRFGHATMLRIKPDGTREHGCFDNVERAVEFATRDEAQR
ncbi:MAG: hypothetical protein ABUL60_20855 [Myxococcales bacterium]